MADEADAAQETLDTFTDSEVARRRRATEGSKPCQRCRAPAFKMKNGVRTKNCRPCWEIEGPPPSLEKEFAEIDAAKANAAKEQTKRVLFDD